MSEISEGPWQGHGSLVHPSQCGVGQIRAADYTQFYVAGPRARNVCVSLAPGQMVKFAGAQTSKIGGNMSAAQDSQAEEAEKHSSDKFSY